MASQDMLQPYAPQGLDKIDAKMRDQNNPPSWVGMDGFAAALCVNTIELEKTSSLCPPPGKI